MNLRTVHRRRSILPAVLVVLGLVAIACGGDDADGPAAGGTATTVAAASTAGAAPGTSPEATGPRTIEHRLGTTEVPAAPERVVALGLTDQDYLLALGVVPVGVRDWFGEQPNAVWPWARPLLDGAEPTLLTRELNYEAIAALRPDLITVIYTGLSEEEYALLSAIAPTVTSPPGVEGGEISWQSQTRFTGEILGRESQAEELVAALEAKIDGAVAAYPEFAGLDYAFASVYVGEYYLFGSKSAPATFLDRLGFELPERTRQLTANENDYFVFTGENFEVVDRSVLLWTEGTDDPGVTALLADPLYTRTKVHGEGRDLFLGTDLYGGAFSFSTVLSLDLLVDDLVPALASAVDGDPATVATLGS